MFKTNKYTFWYYQIINTAIARNWRRAKGRERHHVIPRSLAGTNEHDNLVYLSCREHFVCHWLLIKMTDGDARSKMIYALQGMKAKNKHQFRYETRITSRVYERYRKEHAKIHSERMRGKKVWNKGRKLEGQELEQHRERTRTRKIDPIKQAEGQKKRLEKLKNFRHSEETKLKQSIAAKGKLKGPMSEEEKLKRSVKQKGVAKKDGHSDNVRNAVLGNISINKDGVEKKIKRETLDTYLSQGWQLGGRKRNTQ